MMPKNNDLEGSMGYDAAASENARMESFHSLLKLKVLNTRQWEIRQKLRIAIVS